MDVSQNNQLFHGKRVVLGKKLPVCSSSRCRGFRGQDTRADSISLPTMGKPLFFKTSFQKQIEEISEC